MKSDRNKKEIDAKHREESRRKISERAHAPESRKPTRKPLRFNNLAPAEDLVSKTRNPLKVNSRSVHDLKEENTDIGEETQKSSNGKPEDASHIKNASHGDVPFSGPLQVSTSSGFAWAVSGVALSI